MEPDRRKFPRKDIKLKIEYVLQNDLEKNRVFKMRSTHSANIGGGGLCMYLDEDIVWKEGSLLYLIINMPDQNKIFAPAQVIHIQPDSTKEYRYKIGLRYLDMSAKDRITLMNVLGLMGTLPLYLVEGIRKKSYELYENRGYTHGHDLADWFEAEKVILGK